MSDNRYKAFISYNHQDEIWARWLQHALEAYRIPKRLVGTDGKYGRIPKRLKPVFRDLEDLSASANLSDSVISELEASESLIVICSPAAAQSRWVNDEIRQFRLLGREDRIYALIVDGDPQTDDPATQCFPAALVENEGSNKIEPLASDVRKWADGKRVARLKLIAGLLGIGLDQLRQRDLQRRRKRQVIVGLAMVAVLALSVMTVVSQIAEQHEREKAEQLATFIVDLGERLKSDVDLETLAIISAESFKHLQGLDPDKLSPETGKKVALSLRQMGQISQYQGKQDDALESFQRSRDLLARLYNRYPEVPELLFELGNAEYYIGNLHIEQDRYESALASWQNYHRLTRTLLDTDPDNPEWIMERSYSHNNLAAVQLANGKGVDDDTLTHLEEAIELVEQAMQLRPDNKAFVSHYSTTLAWAATAQSLACNLDNAMSLRTKVRQLAEVSARSDPGNNDFKRRHSYAIYGVGTTQVHVGKLGLAEQNWRLAISMLQELSDADPSNVFYHHEIVEREIWLAKLVADRGRLQEASALMSALEPRIQPGNNFPKQDDEAEQTYINFLLTAANIEFLMGNIAAADNKWQQALQLQLARPNSQHSEQEKQNMRFQWWEMHGDEVADVFPDVPDFNQAGTGTHRSCEDAVIAAKLSVLKGDLDSAAEPVAYLQQRGYADPAYIRFCRKFDLCTG